MSNRFEATLEAKVVASFKLMDATASDVAGESAEKLIPTIILTPATIQLLRGLGDQVILGGIAVSMATGHASVGALADVRTVVDAVGYACGLLGGDG